MDESNGEGIRSIQDFYNDIALHFADEWYPNDLLMPVLKELVSLMPPNPRVLDLGCGAGYESMRLSKLGAEVVGIDYCEEPIKIARQRNPDLKFELLDFMHLDESRRLELGFFDGIAAIASLIHVDDKDLDNAFHIMRSLLKPDGFILLVVVEGEGLDERRSYPERFNNKYYSPFFLHSKHRLDKSALNAGFVFYNELTIDVMLQPHGWKCFIYQTTVYKK